jgi:hypothetical protein
VDCAERRKEGLRMLCRRCGDLFSGEYSDDPSFGVWAPRRIDSDEYTVDELASVGGCFICHRVWEWVLHESHGQRPSWPRFVIERQVVFTSVSSGFVKITLVTIETPTRVLLAVELGLSIDEGRSGAYCSREAN